MCGTEIRNREIMAWLCNDDDPIPIFLMAIIKFDKGLDLWSRNCSALSKNRLFIRAYVLGGF